MQQARREAGLDVSDRISLAVAGTPAARAALAAHQQLIASETLATTLDLVEATALDGDPLASEPTAVGDGESVRIRVTD